MAPTKTNSRASLATVEDALRVVLRLGRLPRVQEQLAARAGVSIDPAAYPVLGRIAQDGPIRMTNVATSLALDLSTVSRHVQHLQEAGFIKRAADAQDRRASVLTVSREGKRAFDRLREAGRESLGAALAGWSHSELDDLSDMLGRLAADLEHYWADA